MSTRYFHATKSEIERLCGYITDDGAIAAYYGIDRADVAKVRADIPKGRTNRFLPQRYETPSQSTGNGDQNTARQDAKDGSDRLLAALMRMASGERHSPKRMNKNSEAQQASVNSESRGA